MKLQTLNDSKIPGLSYGTTEIWYRKDLEPFCYQWRPQWEYYDRKNLTESHSLLGKIKCTDLLEIFKTLQGFIWSKNGEANLLIENCQDVWHTSMSVGDIIVTNKDAYLVTSIGFEPHQRTVSY